MIGIVITPKMHIRTIARINAIASHLVLIDRLERNSTISFEQVYNFYIPIHTFISDYSPTLDDEISVFNPKPITGRIQLIRHGRHWIYKYLDLLKHK